MRLGGSGGKQRPNNRTLMRQPEVNEHSHTRWVIAVFTLVEKCQKLVYDVTWVARVAKDAHNDNDALAKLAFFGQRATYRPPVIII